MIQENEFVKELAEKHGRRRDSLLPILQDIVEERSYLSDDVMVDVAKALDISAADVFGTATFYSFLETEPRGKYIIRICKFDEGKIILFTKTIGRFCCQRATAT